MSFKSTGCACGETSERSAIISRSMSGYLWKNVPTGEIEQIKGWLTSIQQDCEFKISQLESLERSRNTSEEWRNDINDIARQFYDPDSLHLDIETRQKIIQQRLGCEPHRARHIAERVHKWAINKTKTNRNEEICFKHRNKVSVTKIAQEYKISRQQVYNILKDDKKTQYFK